MRLLNYKRSSSWGRHSLPSSSMNLACPQKMKILSFHLTSLSAGESVRKLRWLKFPSTDVPEHLLTGSSPRLDSLSFPKYPGFSFASFHQASPCCKAGRLLRWATLLPPGMHLPCGEGLPNSLAFSRSEKIIKPDSNIWRKVLSSVVPQIYFEFQWRENSRV